MSTHPPTYGAHARGLLRLGVPLVGSAVAGFAIHMTDTIMLGWYSVLSLAAATLATSFWFVIFIVGAGFGTAVLPMVAEAASSGDEVRARRVTRMGIWLSLLYFAIAFVPLWWSGTVFLWLGQTPEVAAEGQLYIRIAMWGMIPGLQTVVFRSYLSGLHLTAVQLWVTLAGVVLNALVNYALIFGNWGAPEMGIQGAATASVIIQTLTVIVLAVYAQVKLPHYHLFQRIWRADWQAFWQVFRLGLPIGLTSLAEGGLFSASAVMMGWIGEIELAAHGITLQIVALMFMFHVGMSQAATIRAGGAYGRRDVTELWMIARTAMAIAILFGVLAVAVMVGMPETLVSLFIDPQEPARDALLALAVKLLFLGALFQFVDSAQINALALLRGVQDTNVPMWLASVSYWVIGLPASYLMAFTFGLRESGLWLGLTVGLGMAALTLGWRFVMVSGRISSSAPRHAG